MTAYTQIELRCDGGPGPYDCEPPIYEVNLARAEAEARRQGWVKKGQKHLCSDHQDRDSGS